MGALRVLVAEDSVVARALLTSIINRDPGLEVVGEARDGEQAVELAAKLTPDVITMDVHMPKVDGLEATRRIMAETPTPIVVISAIDPKDVRLSFEALDSGALAVLAKPTGPTAPDFAQRASEIVNTVKTMAGVRVVRRRLRLRSANAPAAATPAARPAATPAAVPPRPVAAARPSVRRMIDIVAIGSSTGGPDALGKIVGALPADAPVPIVIVQHITVGFHQGLVDWLNNVTPLRVRLGGDGESLAPGDVVIAPGEHQMAIAPGRRLKLTDEGPVGGHKPSATHLFHSVARVYGNSALGVILTGMGDDGADGLVALHNAGSWVIGQDQASCVVYGMPREAALRGAVSEVLPLGDIASAVVAAWRHGRLAA